MQVSSRQTAAVQFRAADRSSAWLAARFLGALSVLSVGAVHLQQYNYLYSTIPTIVPPNRSSPDPHPVSSFCPIGSSLGQ